MKTLSSSPLIAVAPMMNCTDRHDRYFLRLIAPDILLYTEMLTAHALVYGDYQHLLSFHPSEKYVALQLGGSQPQLLARAAKIGESFGYDEINLNIGCPSPRVSRGRFGACLMLEPQLVADCVIAMQSQVTIPVTVKCRIGVDNQDSYQSLKKFIQVVAYAGCQTFIIHARKALLSGLSPKQNRQIPPLHYEIVHQVKQDFPALTIVINGGIQTIEEMHTQLAYVDGVMIGRAAYSNPYFLSEIQASYFQKKPLQRNEIVHHYIDYVREQLAHGVKLSSMTRHILGLFNGRPGAAAWRRYLSEAVSKPEANEDIIAKALKLVS